MCGICGVTKKDQGLIDTLNASLTHRGPDGSSTFVADGISLGHNRLAIIDLSDKAAQPMRTNDGRFVLVFNGEIYNYRELKQEIGDRYNFSSLSDSEVLLAALSLWGVAALSKLRGIFAFALWDNQEQELLLCRDHMGVKPLYYHIVDGELYFSSELGSFTRLGATTINHNRLALYFGLNYTPAGESLVSGVLKLPAGHYLKCKHGTSELVEYCDVFTGDGVATTDSDIYTAIDQAVARQLVSDRPVGVAGGYDIFRRLKIS